MPSLWYCCECSFGPHNSALYDACIQCGNTRCTRCLEEKISLKMNMNNTPCCHTTSPYPAIAALDPSRPVSPSSSPRPLLPLPSTMDLTALPHVRSSLLHEDQTRFSPASVGPTHLYSQTYMYICCKCNDGPKVYNHQPRCVVCSHEACGGCTYVK
ncbi:hypothetical protein NUU61_002285 [Penicillium alfredii]|uniref:RanBP2-type domain-containing protein n=1 Tax=Penicillium alfredii TaxID=1506179 RepID=A0A9W9KGQ9_9EURO|nr:uncharacterized protein NUU61_002285 [Penicillium alfredii]KAJ5104938.1 hypothetical protein NUU61_002285 [Penicillium alfredii]